MAASTIVSAASRQARRLGHRTLGPPLVVLAVLREEDGAAKRALLAVGLTAEDYESAFAEVYRTGAPPDDGGIASNPRFLAVEGAARAFAATAGRRDPDAADAALLDLLLERHPPGDGPQWDFKPLGDRRQVIVHEAELDLTLLVAEADRIGRRL